ncbi:MAG: dihydroorotate dehydrogenase electron transfer subunit [Acidobacteriota bacterium]
MSDTVPLPRGNFVLTLKAPEVARNCRPGQFVMIAPLEGYSPPQPLLKRALAVYSVGRQRLSTIRLLVKVVGPGTLGLASLRAGALTSLIGPLGNGFDLNAGGGKIHLLLAGGIGIASLYLLAEQLLARGEQVHLLYGGRKSEDLVGLEDFRRLGMPVQLTTDDGSAGFKGLVTEGLLQYMEKFSHDRLIFYACGPDPMMRSVAAIAARSHIPCQVSVETKMACGFGVCLGCSVKTVHSYRLACTDGPVFAAEDIVWPTGEEGGDTVLSPGSENAPGIPPGEEIRREPLGQRESGQIEVGGEWKKQ